jgi:hypothetical protein
MTNQKVTPAKLAEMATATPPVPLAVVEEYGYQAADKWVRLDIGFLELTPAGIGEACRKLTRTMLSVRALREGENFPDNAAAGGYTFTPAAEVPELLERLAMEEDRSITWPTYPDPVTRYASPFYNDPSRYPRRGSGAL